MLLLIFFNNRQEDYIIYVGEYYIHGYKKTLPYQEIGQLQDI